MWQIVAARLKLYSRPDFFDTLTAMLGLTRSFESILTCRTFAVLGQFLVVLVAHFWLNISFSLTYVLAILLFSIIITGLSYLYKHRYPISNRHIFYQLSYDVFSFTALLMVTGGIQNPFTGLYLIQVIIASVMLPTRYTWFIVGLSIASYLSLTLLSTGHHAHHSGLMHWHMQGMILSYMISAVLVAIFIGQIVKNHREQTESILALQQQLKDDAMLGQVGLLATNAVHELSTPLSTIGLIADELEQNEADHSLTVLLKKQVERCKTLLQEILLSFGTVRADESRSLRPNEYVNLLQAQVKQRHPVYRIPIQRTDTVDTPFLIPSLLDRAVHNLIDNAIAVCPDKTSCTLSFTTDGLRIDVKDEGPGIPQDVLDTVSDFKHKPSFQKKGLGLYLTHTIITKMDGQLSFNTESGNTVTLELPLERASI